MRRIERSQERSKELREDEGMKCKVGMEGATENTEDSNTSLRASVKGSKKGDVNAIKGRK